MSNKSNGMIMMSLNGDDDDEFQDANEDTFSINSYQQRFLEGGESSQYRKASEQKSTKNGEDSRLTNRSKGNSSMRSGQAMSRNVDEDEFQDAKEDTFSISSSQKRFLEGG